MNNMLMSRNTMDESHVYKLYQQRALTQELENQNFEGLPFIEFNGVF